MPGTLTRQEIRKLVLEKGVIDQHDLTTSLSSVSYELRVGSYWDTAAQMSRDLPRGQRIALAPNGFVLVGTLERVNLPDDILGLLYLRSTYARRGFVPWFMGIVDPGYAGTLTLALHNLTDQFLPITGHERICHLVLEALSEPVDRGYDGPYDQSQGATPARERDVPSVRIVGQTPIAAVLGVDDTVLHDEG